MSLTSEENSAVDPASEKFGLQPPQILSQQEIKQVSPAALAYLGDAVYELYIRTIYLLPPKRQHLYHQLVVGHVRAESQASYLRSLIPHLTPVEQEIIRRGRNATFRRPSRVSPAIYQDATSLETLIGYLYLTDPQRLKQLLGYLNLGSEESGVKK